MKMPHKLLGLLAMSALACDPQHAEWGLEAIRTLPTPPDPPNLTCGVTLPTDSHALERASCTFAPGTHAEDTLGLTPELAAAMPIRHIIVLMKENRSFDHLFGSLHTDQPETEGVPPEFVNPDVNGEPIQAFHQTNTCLAQDPGHQSAQMAVCVNGGKMDGFVRNAAESTGTDGRFAMGMYTAQDLPFNYWLANTFALSDRHFAPMRSSTYGNRNFVLFASNAGVVDTGIVFPPPTTLSVLHLLMGAGFTWGAYSNDEVFSGALNWHADSPGVHSLEELYTALKEGTLPNVVFIDADENVTDDHPSADLQAGEAWTRKIYDRVVASPQWPQTAMVWTYDEGGAFFDHVPPPPGCQASADSPFTERGVRVPLVVISPWAKRHYVSHVVHDHTAITRLIETVFHLPALTARDANSDALLDMFDFSCGRDLSVEAPPEPGHGACGQAGAGTETGGT